MEQGGRDEGGAGRGKGGAGGGRERMKEGKREKQARIGWRGGRVERG